LKETSWRNNCEQNISNIAAKSQQNVSNYKQNRSKSQQNSSKIAAKLTQFIRNILSGTL